MQLRIKKLSKIFKPISLVDKIFKSQGFKKIVGKDFSYYCLSIKDNITNTSYELRIPLKVAYPNDKKSIFKIGEIILTAKSPLKDNKIPKPIINAAYEKLYDVFSYLNIVSKKEGYFNNISYLF